MPRLIFPITCVFAGLALAPLATWAQAQETPFNRCVVEALNSPNPESQIFALSRAKNLARQAAEAANGGLEFYRAEASMHAPVRESPCTVNENGSWTFTFKGNRPGESVMSIESAVTIDPKEWQISVDYNGPVR